MKNIKYKRKNKGIKIKYVVCVFVIFLITISIGYSLLSTKLTIIGSVTGSQKSNYPPGNSQYTYENRYHWGGGDTPFMYDVHMTILNLDEDYSESLEVSFDIDDGFLPEESSNCCGIWQASSITKEGNRVTIVFNPYAAWLQLGSSLELYFQFPFDTSVELEEIKIKNLTLNGKLATFVTEL